MRYLPSIYIKKKIQIALMGFILTSVSGALQADPIVTDRPDFTESSEVVPNRSFQIESGYSYQEKDASKEHAVGEMLLRISITPKIEARVGINSLSFKEEGAEKRSGLEDTSLGVKIKLLEGQEGTFLPNFAAIVGFSLPTGGHDFRENAVQPELKLCSTWDLNESLSLGANLNAGWASEAGKRFNQLSASLALAISLTENWGTFIELYGFRPVSADGSNSTHFHTGFAYLLSEDTQLDVRYGKGLTSEKEYFIGFGLSSRFGY